MAEEDPSQERRPDNFHRGRAYLNRSFSGYRGRGRGRGDVRRTLNELGVTDLREHLNRKHHTDQSKSPPSDPSYNFLRDPTREQTSPVLKSPCSHRPSRSKQQDTYIQNPLNIKVELTTQTGQRNYSIDDDSTLPSIKHVPDYPYNELSDERFRGSRSARARGKNRYNLEERAKSSERKYDDETNEKPTSQIRSRSVESRSDTSKTRGRSSYRSRGNYRGRQRSTEYENVGRGSKPRGRGRGRSFRYRGDASNRRYQHSDNTADDDREPQADQTEADQNWDEDANKECIKKLEHQHHEETDDQDNAEEHEEPSKQAEEEPKENLVITSLDENKSKKRMVRFKENEGSGEEQSNNVEGCQKGILEKS